MSDVLVQISRQPSISLYSYSEQNKFLDTAMMSKSGTDEFNKRVYSDGITKNEFSQLKNIATSTGKTTIKFGFFLKNRNKNLLKIKARCKIACGGSGASIDLLSCGISDTGVIEILDQVISLHKDGDINFPGYYDYDSDYHDISNLSYIKFFGSIVYDTPPVPTSECLLEDGYFLIE